MAILGVWMWAQNVQRFGAEKVAGYCARAGVTDIFFLTKGLSGMVNYRSQMAPPGCERDLLREITEASHRLGIRVHAWFTSACDEHYKNQFPDSGRCHFVRGKDRELISLADGGYLSYMEQIIREVCRRYDIDGLHLDYIRYNHLLYGWAEEDLQRYAAEGADIGHLKRLVKRMFLDNPKEESLLFDVWRAGDESVLALARTRRKDVLAFAKPLIGAARAEKSGLIVSAALMPEGAYEDTAFSDLHYGQNYEDAAALFDYALPMAYSQAYEQDAQWVKRVALGTMKRGLKTIAGLHAYEGGTGDTLQADLMALKDTGVAGVCLFREGATAFACAAGREASVCNTLSEDVTQVHFMHGEETLALTETIAPGEEKTFILPFEPEKIRIFTGSTERCVYLARN